MSLDAREVARLVEEGQVEATRKIAAEWMPCADGGAGFEIVGSYMNRACGLGMEGPVRGEDLDALVAFYVARGVEPNVEVSAYAHESVLRGLGARGFVLREIENVFAREIGPDDDDAALLPHGPPEGVTIERVDVHDDGALRAYLDMASSGFLPEGAVVSDAYRSAGIKGARLPSSDPFVAKMKGEVVGAGGSGTLAGVTALFGATVARPFRGKGIQQALIAARLAAGRKRGAKLAVIHAHAGIATERNAQRLGFRLTCVRVVLAQPRLDLAPLQG